MVIKSILFGSLILFGMILLLTVMGCVACMSGAGDQFYCGVFRYTGISALAISFIVTGIYVIRSLKRS